MFDNGAERVWKAVKHSRRESPIKWRERDLHSSYAGKVLHARKEEIMRDRLRQKVDGSLFAYFHGKGSWK